MLNFICGKKKLNWSYIWLPIYGGSKYLAAGLLVKSTTNDLKFIWKKNNLKASSPTLFLIRIDFVIKKTAVDLKGIEWGLKFEGLAFLFSNTSKYLSNMAYEHKV